MEIHISWTKWNYYTIVIFIIVATFIGCADTSCELTVTELWAYNNPSTEHFKDSYVKYITSDKGSKCQWLILSSHKEDAVQLDFPDFDLKKMSGNDVGDCLYVYDGPSEKDDLIQGYCSASPTRSFISSGRELLVIYKRGEVEGDRSFTMSFVSKDVLNKEKMIRIAGIIGACIAAAVLVFITLRATRCCKLFKSKEEEEAADIGGSTLVLSARERDRLTHGEGGNEGSLDGGRREARRVHGSAASLNRLSVSDLSVTVVDRNSNNCGGATPSAPLATAEGDFAEGHELSSDRRGPDGGSPRSSSSTNASEGSSGDVDPVELPPSYESLFLDENGEFPTEKPPEYTPPKHHRKHPPRRVHTFN